MRAGTGGDEAGLWAGDLVGTCLFCCLRCIRKSILSFSYLEHEYMTCSNGIYSKSCWP